jgi:hypothetical protein
MLEGRSRGIGERRTDVERELGKEDGCGERVGNGERPARGGEEKKKQRRIAF